MHDKKPTRAKKRKGMQDLGKLIQKSRGKPAWRKRTRFLGSVTKGDKEDFDFVQKSKWSVGAKVDKEGPTPESGGRSSKQMESARLSGLDFCSCSNLTLLSQNTLNCGFPDCRGYVEF